MKYRLLKDCPHGDRGSEWIESPPGVDDGIERHMKLVGGKGYGSGWFTIPRTTFSNWFEELKEIKKFTKEQAHTVIEELKVPEVYRYENWYEEFITWLEENTET